MWGRKECPPVVECGGDHNMGKYVMQSKVDRKMGGEKTGGCRLIYDV